MYGDNSITRLNASLAGAIEDLDLNFETSSIEDTDNLRLEIEKLRAVAEDQILKLREEYLHQESDLLSQIESETERNLIITTRPDCLFGAESVLNLESIRIQDPRVSKENPKRMPWVSSEEVLTSSKKAFESDSQALVSSGKSKNYAKDRQDEELAELERRIQAEMEEEFQRNERVLEQEYNEKMEEAVKSVEVKLSQYWESRAEELEEKIKALEETKPKSSKDIEKKYQEYYEELLEKEKEELAEELEAQIREKYENLLQQEMSSSSGLDYETEKQIREEMEYAFQQRLREEKQAWQDELETNTMHEMRKKSEFSLKQKIELLEDKVKQEATEEINQKILQIKKEADEKITGYIIESQKEDFYSMKQRLKKNSSRN